ncbi:hypothetical protein [Micromonospora sp. NBC_00421]|uniref:hypothetical protein n=1 Tax=Micromonospora sp. NBC_00421 TaxID=2975976 RepID=UPI002E21BB09
MRASTDIDTLSDFSDRYGVALTTGHVPAIAGCYALPGLVVGERYRYLLRGTQDGPAICTVVRTG